MYSISDVFYRVVISNHSITEVNPMRAPADKSPDTQHQTVAHTATQKQDRSDAELQFIDNRAETTSLRQLQEAVDNSPRTQGLAQLKGMMNSSPRRGAMQSLQAMVDNRPSRTSVESQAGADDVTVQRVEDEAVLQGGFDAESPAQLAQPVEDKPNNTGLPDNLKAGVESLSGLSLDNVKVHYNSSEPAQLNAHAYAQGTDIHLGPRQEQHLPHEAWHVVQQAQGRVKPTVQMKGGVGVNDDVGLEREADLMGRRVEAGFVQARQEFGGSIVEKTVTSTDACHPIIQRCDTDSEEEDSEMDISIESEDANDEDFDPAIYQEEDEIQDAIDDAVPAWQANIPYNTYQTTVTGSKYWTPNDGLVDFDAPKHGTAPIVKAGSVNVVTDNLQQYIPNNVFYMGNAAVASRGNHNTVANILYEQAHPSQYGGNSPPNFTWHHNAFVVGQLDLLDRSDHAKIKHKGGHSVWGT